MAQVDPEKERILRQRQEKLSALANHPGFKELREIFETKKEKHLKTLAADIMASGIVEQRRVDWTRGFWAGCTWLLKNPGSAEDTLEKALAAAQLMEEHGNA